MKQLTLALLLVAAAALSGCFEPSTEWMKAGASPDELRFVRQDCEHQSSDYAFVDESRYEDNRRLPARQTSATADTYRRCMESQGWRRQRINQPAAAK